MNTKEATKQLASLVERDDFRQALDALSSTQLETLSASLRSLRLLTPWERSDRGWGRREMASGNVVVRIQETMNGNFFPQYSCSPAPLGLMTSNLRAAMKDIDERLTALGYRLLGGVPEL